VWGFTAKLSDLEVDVEDTAKIGLRFANGALGSIHLDYNQQPPSHYFEVVGTKGSLQWNLSDGATRIYRADKKDWETYPLPASWERNVMFMEEMKHFIVVARGEVESSCPLEDGIRVMRLAQAVKESSSTQRVISL
ncbi:MAG: Gfo/Idh/MocA family oxidoreductase, partial [Anaerolineae bacterium]|nr:Gfo/Idh/MocA family oxidoreductase [Anaerolineae bacterium]